MGVVVLNPQDCLKQPFSHKALVSSSRHMKRPRNPNPNRANRAQPNRRTRRSPARPNDTAPQTGATAMVQKPPADKLDMSHVKILKRGEELNETTPDPPSPKVAGRETGLNNKDLASPVRLSRDPESNRVMGFYAGSSMCIESPPPSSLPLPAFFKKKSVVSTNVEATSFLLSVLRLDL